MPKPTRFELGQRVSATHRVRFEYQWPSSWQDWEQERRQEAALADSDAFVSDGWERLAVGSDDALEDRKNLYRKPFLEPVKGVVIGRRKRMIGYRFDAYDSLDGGGGGVYFYGQKAYWVWLVVETLEQKKPWLCLSDDME